MYIQTTDGNNLFMPLYHISCLCHRQCQRSCLQFTRLCVDQSLRMNMFLSLWFSVSVSLTRPLSLFPSLALSLPRMISRFLSLALSFSFTPILILACDWMISSRVHACYDVTKVSGRRRREIMRDRDRASKEKKEKEKKEKVLLCESIGHRLLRGRCPKSKREVVNLLSPSWEIVFGFLLEL